MRVIGGSLRGRRLRAPSGERTRPTPDRVREGLFSILSPRIQGARVLDGYAGTGSVGIEALSRGALACTFVEKDRVAARILEANLEVLDLRPRSRVIRRPFARAVAGIIRDEGPLDIAFLDPPYGPGEILRALRLSASEGLLRPTGLLVAQHERGLLPPAEEGTLIRTRQVRYGNTVLSFYEHHGGLAEARVEGNGD